MNVCFVLVVGCVLSVAVSYPFDNAIKWESVSYTDLLIVAQEPVGIENQTNHLFLCRINFEGNDVPGKLCVTSDAFLCKVAFRGREFSSSNFQILQAFPGTTSWRKRTSPLQINENMVSSGKMDEETSYVCRSKLGDDLIPGRLSPSRSSCLMAKDGYEYERTETVEVLERNGFGSYRGTSLP